MRTFVIATVLLLSVPVSGQNWMRITEKFHNLYENHQYEKALEYAVKALDYSTGRLDSTDIRFILSHYNAAKAYYSLGQVERAKSYIRTAYELMAPTVTYDANLAEICELYGRIETSLGFHRSASLMLDNARDIKEKVYGKESYKYVRTLYFMAELEMARSRYEDMVRILDDALDLHERLFPKNHEFALYANYAGLIYMNSGEYLKAALYFDRALSAYEVPGVTINITCAHLHNNLGLVHYYRADYENAAIHFGKADSTYAAILTDYSEHYAMLLSNLASLYYSWNKPAEAAAAYKRLESYLGRNRNEKDLYYIQGTENIANYYAAVDDLETSGVYYRKAIEIRKSVIPADFANLALSYQSLASVHYSGGKLKETAQVLLESVREVIPRLPKGDEQSVNTFTFLGSVYYELGQTEKAFFYWKLAREHFEEGPARPSRNMLTVYNNLGILFTEKEMFREAIGCYEAARTMDPGDPDVLMNLGMAYLKIRNPARAREMLDQARNAYRMKFGDNHPDYASALVLSATLRFNNGVFEDGSLEEIRIAERIMLENHVDSTGRKFIDCLRAYRQYYTGTRDYPRALHYAKRAVQLARTGYGRHAKFYAETLLELGDNYVLAGDRENLDRVYDQALGIADRLEPSERENLRHFIELGRVSDYYMLGDYQQSRQSAEWIIERDKERFLRISSILSVQERTLYIGELFHLEFYNNFLMRFPGDPEVISNALNNRLFIKGLLMDSQRGQMAALERTQDSAVVEMHERYLKEKQLLAGLKSQFGLDPGVADSVESVILQLEREISRRLGPDVALQDRPVTWQDIRNSLGEDEAAVEMLFFYYRTDPPGVTLHPWYAAFVITSETVDHPGFVLMPDGVELGEEYGMYRQKIEAGNDQWTADPGLYDGLWSKLDTMLEGKATIYFSPDGVYHQVNVEALADRDGTYVLDRHEIRYVNSLKDLLREERVCSGPGNALLAGDPRFRMSLSSVPDEIPEDVSGSVSEYQSRAFPGTFLTALPGTRTEVDSIAGMLDSAGWQCTVLTGPSASEGAVSSVKNPRLLHLATHGFFAENPFRSGDTVSVEKERSCCSMDAESFSRSCLFFSGAQNTLFYAYDYEEGTDDGILTAWEIMDMDLDSTELVVLSACETGLGDVVQSEGIYGLRRAFHLAGARRVMISLWDVDDQATQLLMRKFYSNWLSGMDMDRSLAEAKRYLIRRTEFSHPRYWAAFILSGI